MIIIIKICNKTTINLKTSSIEILIIKHLIFIRNKTEKKKKIKNYNSKTIQLTNL